MNAHGLIVTATAGLIGLSLPVGEAEAQFGFPGVFNMPTEDFTWIWGRIRERDLGRRPDVSTVGFDAGFRCELTAKLSPGSRMDTIEVRQLENQLGTASFFIESAANAMYVLEQQREIDWGKLDCKKPQADDESEAEVQERLDRARERAEKRRDRRRARESED
jgi:hypothetical protein